MIELKHHDRAHVLPTETGRTHDKFIICGIKLVIVLRIEGWEISVEN